MGFWKTRVLQLSVILLALGSDPLRAEEITQQADSGITQIVYDYMLSLFKVFAFFPIFRSHPRSRAFSGLDPSFLGAGTELFRGWSRAF